MSREDFNKRILRRNELFQRSINYLKRNAPYYPQYEFFKQADFLDEIMDDSLEKVEFDGTETHYITCLVRHEHEGIWYARHHVQSRVVTFEAEEPIWAIKEKLTQQLTHAVYLDLRFGKIDPDFKRQNGEPLDPKDKLQVSEKERLNL